MTKKILTLDEHPELIPALRELFIGADIYSADIKEVTVEEDLVTVKANLSVFGKRSAWWMDSTFRLRLRESPEAEKERLIAESLSDVAEGNIQQAELLQILDKIKELEAKVRAMGTNRFAADGSENPGWVGELSSLTAVVQKALDSEEENND